MAADGVTAADSRMGTHTWSHAHELIYAHAYRHTHTHKLPHPEPSAVIPACRVSQHKLNRARGRRAFIVPISIATADVKREGELVKIQKKKQKNWLPD